jgi:hypothetical protein
MLGPTEETELRILERIVEVCHLETPGRATYLTRPSHSYKPRYVDHNYVVVRGRSFQEIYARLCWSTDVSHLLRGLARRYVTSDGYLLRRVDGNYNLVASHNPNHDVARKVVDYGTDRVKGRPYIAVHVGFLRERLPHLLSESIHELMTW